MVTSGTKKISKFGSVKSLHPSVSYVNVLSLLVEAFYFALYTFLVWVWQITFAFEDICGRRGRQEGEGAGIEMYTVQMVPQPNTAY